MSSLLLFTITSLCFGQLDATGDPLPDHAIARMGTLRLRHGDRVCGVCFSKDEKSLFSAGHDNAVRQWDAATGKLLREMSGHVLSFNALAISPDGALLAAAGGSADCRVYIWDTATGERIEMIEGESCICGLAFSPDSKTLAWITLEHRLVLWSRASKTKKAFFIPGTGHCLAYSPDGKQLALGYGGGIVRIVDAATGKISRSLRHGHEGEGPSVDCVRYSRDGTMLAIAGGLYSPIQIWDANTGKRLHSLKVEWQLDRSIAFSPDDKTLVSQHRQEIILWDTATGKQRKTILLPTRDYAADFAFSSDGKLLAIAHDGHAISLLDLETGKPLFPLEAHRAMVGSAIFLEGERTIASASNDGTIRFWNANTGKQEREVFRGATSPRCMTLAPTGETIFWGGQRHGIHKLDVETGKETRVLKGHTLGVSSLAVSPNGKRLVSAAGTILKLWDIPTATCVATRDCEYGISALTFLPDGKRFLLAIRESLSVCDVETLKSIGKFDGIEEGPAALSLSADGKKLATRAYGIDYAIRVWDVESRRQTATLETKEGVGAVAIAPDGNRLAFARMFDPAIAVWDIEAKKTVRTLKGHVGHVYALTFSSDGGRLISAGGDTTLMVWDLTKENECCTSESAQQVAHSRQVRLPAGDDHFAWLRGDPQRSDRLAGRPESTAALAGCLGIAVRVGMR